MFQKMESVSGLLVAALIWMNKDREHAELLLDLWFARFRSDLENVIWIDKGVV